MGLRVRAPRHGFSQLATSFFACPRLGILRAPLLRLVSSIRKPGEPDFSNATAQPLVRRGALRRGDFLLRTSPLRFDKQRLGVFVCLGAR